jgi:pentose-5-phosphate-3-epimerase
MIKDSGRAIDLEIDGGVNTETAPVCVQAGASSDRRQLGL